MRKLLFMLLICAGQQAFACQNFAGSYRSSQDASYLLRVVQYDCHEIKWLRSIVDTEFSEVQTIHADPGENYAWGESERANILAFDFYTEEGANVWGEWSRANNGILRMNSFRRLNGDDQVIAYTEMWLPIR